jgi:hypothetical protein
MIITDCEASSYLGRRSDLEIFLIP